MIYSVFTLTDSAGQTSGFATVSRNISERKQSEKERSLIVKSWPMYCA